MQSFTTLKRFCALCFILPFLTSCSVNAYTPPTSDDNASSFTVQDSPIISPCESEADPLFWDLSQTDISQIDQTKKLISFTFDDAPKPSLEPILAVFASFNEENPDCKATATLFCNGCFFNNTNLHTVKAAHALGWELGNHSFSHVDLTKLTNPKLLLEIDKTDDLLSRIDGKPRHLFRPPFGEMNDEIKTAVEVPVINWTIDTKDWTGIIIPFGFVFYVPLLDECLQSFTRGRAGEVADALIDTAGGAFGAVFAMIVTVIVFAVIRRARKRKELKK